MNKLSYTLDNEGNLIAYEFVTMFGHQGLAEWRIDWGEGTADKICLSFWIYSKEKGFIENLSEFPPPFNLKRCHEEEGLPRAIESAKQTMVAIVGNLQTKEVTPFDGTWFFHCPYFHPPAHWFIQYQKDGVQIRRTHPEADSIPWTRTAPDSWLPILTLDGVMRGGARLIDGVPVSQSHLKLLLIEKVKQVKVSPGFWGFCEEAARICGETWVTWVKEDMPNSVETWGRTPLTDNELELLGKAIKADAIEQLKQGEPPLYYTDYRPKKRLLEVLEKNKLEYIGDYLPSKGRYFIGTIPVPDELIASALIP